MIMHLYAFGSLCRGEIDESSDIDLLACLSGKQSGIDPNKFSIYTHERIKEMWKEGNPFSWHLHLESKLVFSSNGIDFISELGRPSQYIAAKNDCEKFKNLFTESLKSLMETSNSVIFNLSCMFLAARNFATCYSLGIGDPIFSRMSPLLIKNKLPIGKEPFEILSRARILSTRGIGSRITEKEVEIVKLISPVIVGWMNNCLENDEGSL